MFWTVTLWGAAGVLLLLAIPVHLRLAIQRDPEIEASVRVTWLFGLVRFRALPRPQKATSPRPSAAREGAEEKRRPRLPRRVVRGLLDPALRQRALRFARDVLRSLRPRDSWVFARIGFDDPADTGRLWGCLGPLGALTSSPNVQLEPVFGAACLRFRAGTHVRVVPGRLLFSMAAFLLSPPVLRAVFVK